MVEIPETAFLDAESSCIALSTDGYRLLFAGGGYPYLWDMEKGDRIPLRLGDEETLESVRAGILEAQISLPLEFPLR